MLDQHSNDLKQRQDLYINRMIAFGVVMVCAVIVAGICYHWEWWPFLGGAVAAVLLLLSGYWDARRLWLDTIADAKTVRHVLRANLETPAAQEPLKPLVLDPKGFLNG